MKRFQLYIILLAAACMHACEPYEKSISPSSPDGIQLDFTVTQNPAYDNQVTLKSNTKGAIPYWDYVFGGTNQKDAVVIMPFGGEFYIKYFAYGAETPKYDSVKVKVTRNDPQYFASPSWDLLTNGAAGKTWVWAFDVPDKSYHGVGPGDSPTPTWWVPSLAEMSDVANDEMVFNLDKGLNFQLKHDGKVTNAGFTFDPEKMTIKINGSDIPKGEKTTYNILTLTANELYMVQQGDGWRKYWHFKRKGFIF
ncbi:hypothetical protein [Chitinophaga sp. sic0106]|uniref:hypothetical protein n=1 Tax=Chitinophaga sp. sic0106 TaxID=2854785 RepID=UPI001C474FBC|nr:hypothetical protein [Chitinophaga sp. sic0106]MBV7531475.1 hypothetical protein [Chitinophaga sp. sic0106]